MIIGFVSTPNVEIIISENINFDPNFEANLNIELANRLKISENLADLNDAEQARNNIEVYSKDYLNSRIGKNHIINGNFDVWQRGVSFNQANAFGPDRWRIWNSGATVSFTRQDFPIGQDEVPNNPKFYININHIKDIISYTNSRLQIKVNHYSEQEIIVSREKVRDFKLWLE